MTTKRTSARSLRSRPAPSFTPVPVRPRADGWTADRQVEFIEALAECACVDEACRRVGMTATSAYALRRRADAGSFRQAWGIALDYAVDRLSDAVFARAIHGVATPVFYKGERIGERVHYDNKLATFVLRYRDPVRYGAWLDRATMERAPDAAAATLHRATKVVLRDGVAADLGIDPPPCVPIATRRVVTAEQAEEQEQRRLAAEHEAMYRAPDFKDLLKFKSDLDSDGDVA